MSLRSAAPLALALLLACLMPPAAAAGYPTKVVVSLKTPAFHGKLRSPRGACVEGRRVRLFREAPGPDRLLGADRSDAGGRWSIPVGRLRSGASYYAKAAPRGDCRGARSRALKIG